MKTLFITGHSGFIGSHLSEILSNDYDLIGLGKSKLKRTPMIQINQDINDITSKLIPKKVSCIIHLAALTDVLQCQKNPLKCFKVNVQGTQKLLEIARKRDLKFIFLSTSHVFGYPKTIPINEEHPRHPTSIYASSKLCGEVLCESFSKTYGLDISIIRLFSIYGPQSPDHLVTSKIISQILSQNSIKLGNLNTKRDFLFIDDAMSAISLILKKSKGFDTFNVGSGKGHSINDVVTKLMKISKTKKKIEQDTKILRKNDIPEIISDSTKLRKLGWKPKTNFDDGLKITYDWFTEKFSSNKQ